MLIIVHHSSIFIMSEIIIFLKRNFRYRFPLCTKCHRTKHKSYWPYWQFINFPFFPNFLTIVHRDTFTSSFFFGGGEGKEGEKGILPLSLGPKQTIRTFWVHFPLIRTRRRKQLTNQLHSVDVLP